MKTTVEIPDKLFREAKSAAASQGQTLKTYLNQALQEKLSAPRRSPSGWPVPPPKLTRGEMARIQAVMNGEFSRIDPEEWK